METFTISLLFRQGERGGEGVGEGGGGMERLRKDSIRKELGG